MMELVAIQAILTAFAECKPLQKRAMNHWRGWLSITTLRCEPNHQSHLNH